MKSCPGDATSRLYFYYLCEVELKRDGWLGHAETKKNIVHNALLDSSFFTRARTMEYEAYV